MKILVVGPLDADSFADNVQDTLRRLGHEVRTTGPARPRFKNRRLSNAVAILGERLSAQDALLQKHLVRAADEFGPDVVLTMDRTVQKPVLQQMTRHGARAALWFPDAVSNMGRHDLFLAGYDRIFLKNPTLVRQLSVLQGLPVSYLPEAGNPAWHVPQGDYGTREVIMLAGNVHPTRAVLLDRLVRAGLPLEIYGPSLAPWLDFPALRAVHQGRSVTRLEKSRVFRSARVVLNNLHPAEFSGVNCRVFEAAGAGSAILTEERAGFAEAFRIGEELLTFETFDELVEVASELLRDPSRGRPVADAAAARAARDHTYDRRLVQLLDELWSV